MRVFYQLFIIGFSLVILFGCTTESPASTPQVQGNWESFCDETMGYCLGAPPEFFGTNAWRESIGSGGYPLAHISSNSFPLNQSGSMLIEVLHPSQPAACRKKMGVMNPQTRTQDRAKVLQGRIDFFEIFGHDYERENEPYCRAYEGGAGYALCSEKDGKMVLICISQVTDNPQLAEEIFRTFRWTE